ncbi:MAG TPA: prefoldin subunit beta [Candidatus Norongarragalinales archaeon]|nr:prefoldin subunit beta [Candidatus Norongarragalinales archaeon]
MPDVPPEVIEYQNLQQQLQLVMMQKQQMLIQKKELEKALEEVNASAGPFYRFVGTVLVAKEKESLQKELSSEKDELGMRIPLLERQEKKFKERFDVVRKKVEEFVREQQGVAGG